MTNSIFGAWGLFLKLGWLLYMDRCVLTAIPGKGWMLFFLQRVQIVGLVGGEPSEARLAKHSLQHSQGWAHPVHKRR